MSRPGSPLGRRITQMFRGFSNKKKATTEDTKKETVEEPSTSAVEAETVADTIESPAVEQVAQKEEEIPSKLPAIQSSA